MDHSLIIDATESDHLKRFISDWKDSGLTIAAHTSGSTGRPKPIELLKSDMRCSARSMCRKFNLNHESLLALPLSVDYIAGKMMVVRALEAGCRIYAEEPSRHAILRKLSPGVDIDLVSVVPAQIDALLDASMRFRVKRALIGGAAISEADEERVLKAGIEAYATYGMTETCSNVALRPVGQPFYKANSGCSFSVDSRGCLIIESDKMSFRKLVTTDLVELVDRANFKWLGRIDNVINSGGVKVSPEHVETIISRFLPLNSFYVTGRECREWGSEVVAVVERGFMPDDTTLDLIRSSLKRAECPKEWIEVDSIPRTTTGKIKRIVPE